MKPEFLAGFLFVLYLDTVYASTTSLVLSPVSTSISIGASATYQCGSEGTGDDPTLVWSIRTLSGTVVRSDSQLTSAITDGSSNPNDGVIKKNVTFTVTSALTNTAHRLWCGAIDSGTNPSIQIYIPISTTSTASLGGSCSNSVSCSTAFSSCTSSICRCSTGYYDTNGDSNAGGSCSAQSGLGGTCQAGNDLSCSVTSSRCSSTSPFVCECSTGYTQAGSICVTSSVALGEQCVSPTRTCYVSNSYCNGSICVCSSGYYRSFTVCLSKASLGGSCSSSVGCSTTFSSCISSICRCNTGYYDTNGNSNSGGSCSSQSGLGGTCQAGNDLSCSVSNSRCRTTSPIVCECNTGYTQSGSACILNTATLGGSCSASVTCSTTFSSCTSSICSCNNGYYDTNGNSNSGGSCSAQSGLGGTCQVGNDLSCSVSNSRCRSTSPFVCECNTGYTQSGTACILNTATLGGSCSASVTCSTTFSSCTSSICRCNTGYYDTNGNSNSGGSCSAQSGLGGTCQVGNDLSCSVSNSRCRSTSPFVCECNTGYTQSGSACILNTATLGGSCSASVTCSTTFSSCISSLCRCNTGYYDTNGNSNSGGSCSAQVGLGASCSTSVSNSCLDSRASCTGSPATCQCNSGYTNTNGVCVSTSSSSCPSGSSSSSTVTGNTSPSTPSVTVGQTCYTVNLYGTQLMQCRDSKGTSALQSARWLLAPAYTQVTQSTGSFINGDVTNPNLTVSSAQSSYAGDYICQLCYGTSYTRCTNSSTITLIVNGAALTSVSASVSTTAPLRGSSVTFTCTALPAGAATSYRWLKGSTEVSTLQTYTIQSIGTSQAGSYSCQASNSYNTLTSSSFNVDVQYLPEPTGGTTVVTTGDLDVADIVITCNMNANPDVSYYTFYNAANSLLQNTSSNTYTVTSSSGYQVYSCRAQNSLGLSSSQNHDVQEESVGVGAATENTGLGTGTIAAIVLGIIFLLLLIIIIIVCCCSYGWCRKKERVEPQVIIEKPAVKPYIPRTIVSASSTISRKDVGVMVNGHHDVAVSTDFEEPRYATPRYHLKPALNGGPIISMYDDGYEQPRAHQLPALDTQYLYPDDEPKRHKKKKRHHRRREDKSPRRQYYEPEPESEVRYAQTQRASDDDLEVIPGKQNYFE